MSIPGFKRLSIQLGLTAIILSHALGAHAQSGLSPAIYPSEADYVWIFCAAAMVFMMQAGFMCLEAGVAPAKHSINVAIKNLGDFVIAAAAFWTVGFGLMFGTSNSGLIGMSDFLISGSDPWQAVFFIFQCMFVGTAATIVSGAIAGRTRFGAYLILSGVISCLIYPVFGHWAWGGMFHAGQQGWLERMGFIDFAGSTVVHSMGGWVSLAGVIIIGPRTGKFNDDGTPNKIAPHNMTLAYLGTFLLFFGWFGFNGGSTLKAGPDVAPILLNTIIAACFGCITASGASWCLSPLKRPEGEMITNGILGGLVAITAGCASVNALGAAVIGGVGGLVTYGTLNLLEKTFKLDDVVGAIAVHGVSGAWGTMAAGIFITGEKLGEMSRLHLVGVQATGVITCFVWTFGVSVLAMKIINAMTPLRVSVQDEQLGLNVSEHGAHSTLLDLAQTMHNVSCTGDFTGIGHVQVEPGTESGDLAQGFNTMLDMIQSSFNRLKSQQELLNAEKKRAEAALLASETQRRTADRLLREIEETRLAAALNREQHLGTTETYIGSLVEKTQAMSFTMDHSALRARSMIESIHRVAGSISDTSARLQEIAGKSHKNVLLTQQAASEISVSKKHSQELEESAREIGEISSLISQIAAQTRMLSLNALITSANAGDSGKQFAVVANEIRSLASRSSDSAQRIQTQLDTVQDRIGSVISQTDTITGMLENLSRENAQSGTTIVLQSELLTDLNTQILDVTKDSRQVTEVLEKATSEAGRISEKIKETYQGIRHLYQDDARLVSGKEASGV
ncbi:MAG: ammonium transporter [Pseudomonadota bacterium]